MYKVSQKKEATEILDTTQPCVEMGLQLLERWFQNVLGVACLIKYQP